MGRMPLDEAIAIVMTLERDSAAMERPDTLEVYHAAGAVIRKYAHEGIRHWTAMPPKED